MGKKEDIILEFLSRPEVFADLFNGVIFQGESIISAESLEDVPARSRFILKQQGDKTDNVEVLSRERDIIKRACFGDETVYLAIFGVEHQSHVDASMPFRAFQYEAI